MPDPNCTIVLSYYDQYDPPRFSYHCTRSSIGWRVQSDGSIHPPPRSRVVQIRIGYPAGASFTGFQLVADPGTFPSETSIPWHVDTGLGIAVLEPASFPPPSGSSPVLTLDFADSNQLLHYRLAVDGNWDEPKVYNDPDE